MKTDSTHGANPENITERKIEGHRSISGILWNKFLDVVEHSTLKQIFLTILFLILATITTFALTYTHEAQTVFLYLWNLNNHFIPKAALSFLVIFNIHAIFEFVKSIIPELPEAKEEQKGQTIEGIPVLELLDHLFEFESFKRDDIEKKFGIPRNRFTDLAQKLEELCVLQRGENNSRILNKEFARSDIALLLEGKTSAADLRLVSRKINDSTFTYEPAGRSMLDKVKDLLIPTFKESEEVSEEEIESPLPPSPTGFTVRKLNSAE